MTSGIATDIQKLINRQYEYVATDINSENGNDILIFKDGKKKFAIEVYEWEI